MEFGKLSSLNGIDFNLPQDAIQNQDLWPILANTQAEMTVYVGCTGFGMPEWVGTYYPEGTKNPQFLKEYALQFNTIEHNTTHYRIPDEATVQKWYHESTPDFRFCPKIPQTISHSRYLGAESGLVAQFCNSISLLNEKLGVCFMQLPPHFSIEKLAILEHFLKQFPSEIPLSIEVRHESFFENKDNFATFWHLLQDYNTSTVITDVAGRRDVLHQGLTTENAVIRFVGNDLHSTDYQRINDWVERLETWKNKGLKNVYFFTHEPDNLHAPELAEYLVAQLLAKKITTRGPKRLEKKEVPQLSLF